MSFCSYVQKVYMTEEQKNKIKNLCFSVLMSKTLRGDKIKKGNLPRLPIFINLKSNTMKNTLQR